MKKQELLDKLDEIQAEFNKENKLEGQIITLLGHPISVWIDVLTLLNEYVINDPLKAIRYLINRKGI